MRNGTTILIKITLFWDVAPCSLINIIDILGKLPADIFMVYD
jgi:hypothetical protein